MTPQTDTLRELPAIRELTNVELDNVGGGHPISTAPEPTLSQDVTGLVGVAVGLPASIASSGLLGL